MPICSSSGQLSLLRVSSSRDEMDSTLQNFLHSLSDVEERHRTKWLNLFEVTSWLLDTDRYLLRYSERKSLFKSDCTHLAGLPVNCFSRDRVSQTSIFANKQCRAVQAKFRQSARTFSYEFLLCVNDMIISRTRSLKLRHT